MKLVIGNQKAYLGYGAASSFVEGLSTVDSSNAIICPSNIYLELYKDLKIPVGGQDVCADNEGKRTGEITAVQLKELGINYCIVGHSERREYQNETSVTIGKKINQLLGQDIVPILCIGESFEDKEAGKGADVVINQLKEALENVEKDQIGKIIVAYEPVWAISNGIRPNVIPSNTEIKDIVCSIKNFLLDSYGTTVKVIYGGSVNLNNLDELNKIDENDGYLIGGASLKAEEFKKIIEICA